MRRTALSLALVAGIAGACPATAQSPNRFTTDVLLRQEGLGATRLSPDARWLATEVQAPYDAAPTYVFSRMTAQLLSRLELVDTRNGVVRHRLEDPNHAAGFIGGPFSPDGRRMVVYRLTPERWTLGILSLDTGSVDWTNIVPDESQFGRTIGWRNATELLITAHREHTLPLLFRLGDEAQARTRDLWAATASGQQVGATYIPSGRQRDTRQRATPLQLTLLDVSTGARRILARGDIYDFVLSPDGRRLAVMEEREDLQPDPERPVQVGDPMRRRALRLLDLERGEVSLDAQLDYSPYFVAWRPDSGALLAFARPRGTADFEETGRYVVIDAAGRMETVARDLQPPAIERSYWGEPVALGGWDGTTPVLRIAGDDGAPRWRSIDGSMDVAAQPGDRLIRWAGDLRLRRGDRVLTMDLDEVASGDLTGRGNERDSGSRAGWTPDDDAYWGVRSGGCVQAQATSAPTCLDPPRADEQVVAADSSLLVTRQDRADGASGLRIHTADAVRTIETVNADREALDWGDLIEVPHQGPNGAPLKSWLLLPPGLAPGVRAPLVVDVYVGRTAASPPQILGRGSSRLQNNPAVIAGAGYAVLAISLPQPPTGRYSGAELAQRILEIVDRAAEGGRVDPDKVALLGHSYGGYNVLLAAPHSPRFAAVIASNGTADLATHLNLPPLYRVAPDEGVPIGSGIGWLETGQAAVGQFPADADRYVALSPLYQAEQLTVPALLIETDLDRPRFGALFGALYRLDREAAWLSYFGEGHTIESPANVRDLHARILDWLGRYLGPPAGDAVLPVAGPGLQDSGEQGRVQALAPQEP